MVNTKQSATFNCRGNNKFYTYESASTKLLKPKSTVKEANMRLLLNEERV